MNAPRLVGPILQACVRADAVVAAIRAQNPDVTVQDRGSYLRVVVPGRCVVTRAEIERRLKQEFRLPSDLESLMPSFQGRFSVNDEEATWSAPP